MGMTTSIVGFKPLNEPSDAAWQAMKKVWNSCVEANIDIPDEVLDFFEGQPPNDYGTNIDLEGAPGVREYHNGMDSGFEVEVNKIPKDIKVIRFYNSF